MCLILDDDEERPGPLLEEAAFNACTFEEAETGELYVRDDGEEISWGC